MDFGSPDLIALNQEYLKYTAQVAESCTDRDLSEERMVIGTSAIMDTEIDGAVGMNSGNSIIPLSFGGSVGQSIFDTISRYRFSFITRRWMGRTREGSWKTCRVKSII